MLNSTVHTAVGRSPLGLDRLVPLAVGDLVRVKLSTGEVHEGYFAGFLECRKAAVIAAPPHTQKYKCHIVHPTDVHLAAWRGTDEYTRVGGVMVGGTATKHTQQLGEDPFWDDAADFGLDIQSGETAAPASRAGAVQPAGPASQAGCVKTTTHTPKKSVSFSLPEKLAFDSGVDTSPSVTHTHEQPAVAPTTGSMRRKGIVVKDPSTGAYYPAQVIREARGKLKGLHQAVKFNVDGDGSMHASKLVDIPRDEVIRIFDLPSDGKVPSDILRLMVPQAATHTLGGVGRAVEGVGASAAAATADSSSSDNVCEADDAAAPAAEEEDSDTEYPIDVDVVQDHTVMAVSIRKDGKSVALLATHTDSVQPVKSGNNQAKGHLNATKEEVKQGSHDAAMLQELESWVKHGVLGPQLVKYSGPKLRAAWRNTWKLKNGERVAKARLVARGDQDPRDLGEIATYSGTCNPGQDRVADIFCLSRGMNFGVRDVPTAFLKADAHDQQPLALQFPPLLPPGAEKLGFLPGACHMQLKAIYGTAEAARLFHSLLRVEMRAAGWKEIGNSMFAKEDAQGTVTAVCSAHVDDLKMRAHDPAEQLIHGIGRKLGNETATTLKRGEPGNFIGVDMLLEGTNKLRVGKQTYAKGMTTDLTEKEAMKRLTAADLKLADSHGDTDVSSQRQQMKVVGELGWLANVDPNLAFIFSHISKSNTKANSSSVVLAKRIVEYAKRVHVPLVFVGNVRVPVMVCWCDANYNIRTGESRLGFEIQVLDRSEVYVGGDVLAPETIPRYNVVAWRSLKPGRAVGSSSVGELLALREVVRAVPLYTSIVQSLWGVCPAEVYFTDNQAVIDWCHSQYIDRDAQWQGVLNQVIGDLASEQRGATEIRWVPTHEQRADKLTKFVAVG